MTTYTLQIWNGETKVAGYAGWSLEGCRQSAKKAVRLGLTARIIKNGEDWTEVHAPSGVRNGTFAQTVLVKIINH